MQRFADYRHGILANTMTRRYTSQKHRDLSKHAIPSLLLPVLFVVGMWGAASFKVVQREEGMLSEFAPTSLLIGCAVFSVFYGAFCLWMAKLSQKPSEFLEAFFVWVFVVGPFFIGFAAITFSMLVLALNGRLDTSESQTHQTVIQSSSVFDNGGHVRGSRFSYLVYAVDWRNPKAQVRLDINPNHNITKGSRLTVTTRRGFFGYEWIESIRQ